MAFEFYESIISKIPDSSAVSRDDIFSLPYTANWDSSRVSLDGIIISYSLLSSDDLSFSKIKSGGWAPNYIICRGGGKHPDRGTRTRDGQIFQCVSEAYVAYHSRQGNYFPGKFSGLRMAPVISHPDTMTIGIALVANIGDELTERQLGSLAILVKEITDRVQSITRILGRRHLGFDSNLVQKIYEDPEIPDGESSMIEFSSTDLFGRFNDPVLDYDVCYSDENSLYVISGRGLREI